MNRGSAGGTATTATPATRASMRPRFMNRGSHRASMMLMLNPRGFNEAPIHESGKYKMKSLQGEREKRFNEAPIHESGK